MTRHQHRSPLIAYAADGPHGAEAVLLLHSLGADGGMWSDQVASLRSAYRVVAPDTRGHGRSGWTGQATLADWTDDIRRLVDKLGLGRVAIVGASMGGVQAIAFAVEHPDLVSALILAGTFAELAPAVADDKIRAMTNRAAELGMPAFADAYVAETFVVHDARPQTELISKPLAQMVLGAYDASVRTCFEVKLARRLGEITAPTLVLWGEHDMKTPRPLSDQLAMAIPEATLEVVPNAGHLSNLDNPEDFTRRVIAHLKRSGVADMTDARRQGAQDPAAPTSRA